MLQPSLPPARSIFSAIYHRSPINIETNIFDKKWDVVVILDACRLDAMKQMSAEYPWLGQIDSIWSVASTSRAWMNNTFTADNASIMTETAYITGNVYSDEHADSSQFQHLVEVWQDHWDDEIGTIQPRPITDHAIQVARSEDPPRIIIHYMQPHFPSIPRPISNGVELGDFADQQMRVWDAYDKGEVDRQTLWNAYIENLRFVLDEVDVLRNSIDADTMVLTADHGQLFGEWGASGHPGWLAVPDLRRVPWVELSARNNEAYEPDLDGSNTVVEKSVQDRLHNLGYR